MSSYETSVAKVINNTRHRYGLSHLALATKLTSAARKHSLKMADKGCFAHSAPCDVDFAIRIKGYFRGGPYSYVAAGENLLWAQAGITPATVVSRWLASPTHRAVLLSQQWRAVGIGIVHTSHGPGVFKGQDVLVVTADFAVKR
jgi:uncharacterized protein YkwD